MTARFRDMWTVPRIMPALKGKFMILSIEENHTPRSTVSCRYQHPGAYFDLRRSLFVSKDIAQAIGSFAGMVLCEA